MRKHYPQYFAPGLPSPDADTIALLYTEFIHLTRLGLSGLSGVLKES